MNNTNGALDFEATMDNGGFIGAINENERRVKGFSQATVKEGEKIDQAFKITTENIKIQKDVIASIESQIKQLNEQIDKTSPGMAQNDLRKQAAQLTQELNAEKAALTMLEQEVKKTEVAHVSFRTQLRNVREELIQMEMEGKRGTAAYDALQKKAGELNDSYKDAQAQMNVLANDERGFKGIISMVTGVAGVFTAAQGAVGLFAGENENLNKIMQKTTALLGVTYGLQQAAQMLNKDSYFSLVLLKKIKEGLIITEVKLATALGISTAAARVFMATMTLGLSAAITGVILIMSKLITKQQETAKEMKAFREATAEAAYKPIAAFEKLRAEWSSLGKDLKAQKRFVQDNSEAFDKLGIAVRSAADAQKVLVENSGKVREALLDQAEAAAYLEIAEEKYKEIIEMRMKAESMPDKVKKYQTGGYMGQGALETYEVENKEKTKLTEAADEKEKALTEFYTKSAEATKKANEVLHKINEESIKSLKDMTIAQIESAISQKKEALKELTNPADYQKAMKEITSYQNQLAWITERTLVAGSVGAIEEAIKQKKEALKKLTNPADYKKAVKDILDMERDLDIITGRYNPMKKLKPISAPSTLTLNPKLQEDFEKAEMLRLTYMRLGEIYEDVTNRFNQLSRKSAIERIEELKKILAYSKLSSEARLKYLELLSLAEKKLADSTYDSIISVFNLIKNVSSQVAGQVGEQLEKMVDAAEGLYEAADAIKNDKGSSTQQVTGLISGILAMTAALRDWRYESIDIIDPIQQQNKEYEAVAAWVDVTNERLAQQKLLVDDLAGVDHIIASMDLLEQYNRKQAESFTKLRQMNLQYINDSWEEYKDSNIRAEGANKVANFLLWGGQAKTETVYDFKTIDTSSFKDIEQYRDLLLDIEQNGGYYKGKQVVEADLKALQSLIDGYDQFMAEHEGLQDTINELLTGTTAESISESIAQGFAEGKKSIQDFVGDFESLMRNAALRALKIKGIDEPVQQLYQDMVDALKDQDLSDAEKASLRKQYNDIIAGAANMAAAMEEITGPEANGKEALTGSIKGITSDEASMLGGQVNAMRINQAESLNVERNQLMYLANIDKNTAPIIEILNFLRGNPKPGNSSRARGLNV